MKRIFIFVIACLFFQAATLYGKQIVQWNEAHNHYGELITVKGKIVSTYNSGKACFFNFHPDYKKYFSAVIFRSDFGQFPPNPEDYYYGKEVKVTGVIKEYKGKPEIIINNPSQIKIIQTTPISKNPKKKNDGIPSYVTRPAGSVPCKPLKSVSKIQPNEDTGQWEIVDPKSLGETDEMPSYIKKLTCSVPPIKDLLIARYLVDRWIDIECINSAEFEKIVGMLL